MFHFHSDVQKNSGLRSLVCVCVFLGGRGVEHLSSKFRIGIRYLRRAKRNSARSKSKKYHGIALSRKVIVKLS